MAVAGGGGSPFLFTAAWSFGGFAAFLVYFCLCQRDLICADSLRSYLPRSSMFWRSLKTTGEQLDKLDTGRTDGALSFNWQILSLSLSPFVGGVLYVWAFEFLPGVAISVLSESWPVFAAFFLHQMFSRGNKRKDMDGVRTFLFLLVFAGVALVVFSVADTANSGWLPAGETVIGVLLVLASMGSVVASFVRFRWVENAHRFSDRNGTTLERSKADHMMLLTMFSYSASSVFAFAAAWFFPASEAFTTADFALIVLAGMAVNFGGTILEARGIIASEYNPRLQSVRYLTPVFGVLFLWAASHHGGVNVWVFAVGLCVVVCGNVLINFRGAARQSSGSGHYTVKSSVGVSDAGSAT